MAHLTIIFCQHFSVNFDFIVWNAIFYWHAKDENKTQGTATDLGNYRRKWTSHCYGLSFDQNKISAFLDGRKLNLAEKVGPVSEMLSNPKGGPVVVTLGHYEFDDTPLIGRIVDFNMWGRYLTDDEARTYSDCLRHVPRTGDLIDSSADFNISGGLIDRIGIDFEVTACGHENSVNHLYLHVPFKRQLDAKEACDRYQM